MNPDSDFNCELFQHVLASAFAVQERRDVAAEHSAQLEPEEDLAPERPLPEGFGDIEDPEENFVPEFMMLPQNRHSLCARWEAVIVGVMELWGFRHLALLATILARRGRTVFPHDREQDFVSAPVAPAVSQEARILNPRSRWRNFAPSAVAAGLARRAKSFDWPTPWGNFAMKEVAAGLLRLAKNQSRSIRWRNFDTKAFVSGLAHRARNLEKLGRWRNFAFASFASGFAQRTKRPGLPNWRRNFTPATVVSAFAQRAQNLNWSNLRRCSAPAAVIVVVVTFTFLMVYKPFNPAKIVGSSALPGANANAIEHRSSISKPLPGKPALAETVSASPKPIGPAIKVPRRVRVGPNEVEYRGDDVIVRRFTDRPSAKRNRQPNSRIAHIGDDVTVRYFRSPPPARTATR
jgi:hypothetical protein